MDILTNPIVLGTIAILSLLITAFSVILGIKEHRRRVRLEATVRNEHANLIKRIGTNVPSHRRLMERLKNHNKDDTYVELVAWCAQKHQFLSDIYGLTVTAFLNTVKEFSYGDLANLVKNKIIDSEWEEQQWRAIIGLREENKDKVVPTFFLGRKKAVNLESVTKENKSSQGQTPDQVESDQWQDPDQTS